jgi:single-strand DNA-binding protein
MASRSLNRIVLVGNLTRDPELKYTPAGTAVCTFGVATNRSWTTADGQTKDDVQYHRIVAWQKLAELCSKLLTKGRKVYLEGRLTYRTFTGKDNVQRTVAEIVLDDFIVFGDGKRNLATESSVAETSKNENIDLTDESFHEQPEKKTVPVEPKESKNDMNETVSPDDIPF